MEGELGPSRVWPGEKGKERPTIVKGLNFQVIATCSFDRTAAVWEEIVGEKSSGGLNHWVQKTKLCKSMHSQLGLLGEKDKLGGQ